MLRTLNYLSVYFLNCTGPLESYSSGYTVLLTFTENQVNATSQFLMASLWSPGIFLAHVLALLLKALPPVILAETNVYIVYMGDKLRDEPELVQESHHELLADIISLELLVLFETELLVPTQLGVGIFYKCLNLWVEFPRDIPGLVPSLVSWTQVYGQSRKASEMRVWQRCHLVGEGYAKKEKDLIARIVIALSLLTVNTWQQALQTRNKFYFLKQGQALYTGKNGDTFHPIVYGEEIVADDSDEDSARYNTLLLLAYQNPNYSEKIQILIARTFNRSCDSGSLNATLARGRVILCFESRSQRSNIIARRTVLDVKGVGLIFAQSPTKDVTLSLDIPCIQVDFAIGTYLLTYMESSRTRTRCKKSTTFLVNLNLPSITIPELKQNLTVSRTVTNVGPITSIYVARVLAPAGTRVTVEPSVLSFDSTRKKIKFKVTFCSMLRIQGRYSFGNLFLEDGFHVVRIPLIVRTVIDDFYAEI
ncbi:hypothetical protein POTOM_017736 [Populus tomentosa]|uniref:Subtilisin-like protease fibronectin type-III domain-containing protein n=1 Tax=Populus tomentosa TaxID=118781 RepID=A0A8X8AB99_POPTO|nr:hypothetical protein POTOM_017736 [Populus tomentosa]